MARKKLKPAPATMKIKKGDIVMVITGKDEGKTGRILEVDHERGRVTVEGMRMVKRHTKANPAKQLKGGIAERESSIHVSNVMAVNGKGVPERVHIKLSDAGGGVTRRTRVLAKSGETLVDKGRRGN